MAPLTKRPRVLVVDNDRVYCDILHEYLTNHAYDVVVAHTVEEGLEQLQKGPFALAIIDYRLERQTDENDHSGLRLARDASRSFPVPKIVLTSIDSVDNARRAMRRESGRTSAADFLLKRLPLESILNAIEEWIVRAKVFLSYARPDQARVTELYDKLAEAGFEPWMDVELLGGENWEDAIRARLRKADIVLACHSRETDDRRGFRRREIKWALEISEEKLCSDLYLLPVRFEECALDHSLEKLQRVDLFQPDGFGHLAASIREAISRSR